MIDSLKKQYNIYFNKEPKYYLDTGGRLEICGNHTDHNHGLCLVANCSLRIRCVLNKEKDIVRIKSEGFKYFEFYTSDLSEKDSETKTCSLAKGILFRLKELGYKIGGFSCYITSEIPDGSGVSSSAAIESLFGYIISYLYNDGTIPPLIIAKTGQFSENNYFHKPSGLLDQIGTSFDSSNYIDFSNIENPDIQTLPFTLPLSVYLIKSIGDHSNLTPLYAKIPFSMNKVASLLENDKKYLMDIKKDSDIFHKIDLLNDASIEEKCIAKHFFSECLNVIQAKEAIINNDVDKFLKIIKLSQESSKLNLKNTYVEGEFLGSPQEIIDNINAILPENEGAIRIHGGGFKGTVIAFIKNEYAHTFENYIKENYPNRYYKVNISPNAVNFRLI